MKTKAFTSGSGTVTFNISQSSTSIVAIPHGLGRVPKQVISTIRFGGSDPDNLSSVVAPVPPYTKDMFNAIGRRAANAPNTYTATFDWIAIG